MRKVISTAMIFAVLATALVNLSSCEKDEGKEPNLSLKTTSGYTYQDGAIAAGATFTVGITASKSEDEDVLKTFNISRAIGSAASVSVQTVTLTGAQGDSYDQDFTLTAGAAGTTDKWSFTVTNRDGITNTRSFTLTVN